MSYDRWQERRWYVAHTHPAKEAFASGQLERQGFPTFFPQVMRTVKRGRRSGRALRPLFPRYIFVSLNPEVEPWRAVQSTYGVRGLILEGDRPRATPAGLVESMMASSDAEQGFVPRSAMAVGGTVRFLTGPFEDQLGRLVGLDDRERVTVLLDILGAEREVVVPVAQLVAVTG